MPSCTHVQALESAGLKPVKAHPNGCEECLAKGMEWVHLRCCLECGHVGCCDDSDGKHATKHHHHTKHPVMRSYELGEDWGWCFVDELMLEDAQLPHVIRAH
jgi:uncharacterized UBP type Zn finger protein